MKSTLIIGGAIFFIALIAWTIYEMQNAQELPPDDLNFNYTSNQSVLIVIQ